MNPGSRSPFSDRYKFIQTSKKIRYLGYSEFFAIFYILKKKLDLKIDNDNITVLGEKLSKLHINTKTVYYIITKRNSDMYIRNIQNMWRTELSNDNLDLSIFWPNNFPKLADSMSKDIHYLFSYNALVTRNRILNGTDPRQNYANFVFLKIIRIKKKFTCYNFLPEIL